MSVPGLKASGMTPKLPVKALGKTKAGLTPAFVCSHCYIIST